jgi:integrase
MSTKRTPVDGHPGVRVVTWVGGNGRQHKAYEARVRGRDRRLHSQRFDRIAQADGWLVDQKKARRDGTWVNPARGRETLGGFFAEWRAKAVESGGPAPSTLAKYDGVWRLHVEPNLGRFPLAAIARADVEQMRDAVLRAAGPWQATEAVKLTRALLARACKADVLVRNPASAVEMPKTCRTRPRILTPAELEAVVGGLDERWRALALTSAYASLRWSEAVALKVEDLDVKGRRLRVDEKVVEVAGAFEWGSPKTARSARWVDLPELLMPILAAHLLRFPPLLRMEDPRLEGLVFHGAHGGVVRRHVFGADWRQACAAAGLPGVRVEWLRHTGASLAYAATRDLKAVSERLGHSSTRMLDTLYLEVYPDAARAVADAIDELVRASRGLSVGSD